MDSEKMFIEIPDELEVREEIRTIIGKGLIKEQKSNLRRNVLAVAAAAFVLLFMLGFVFPSYASQVPIIGGIFEIFEAEHRDYSPLQDVANEVSDDVGIARLPEEDTRTYILEDGTIKTVNETDGSVTISSGVNPYIINEIDGMSLTIKEVVFDGQNVYFTYHIETDRALGDYYHFGLSEPELWVDGVDLMKYQGFGASPGELQRVSEYNYIAVGSFSFPTFNEDVEYADLHFRLGSWQVEFPIERIDSEVIQVNETVSNEGFEATVTEVSISTIGGLIYYDFSKPPGYGILGWDFFTSSSTPDGTEANFEIKVSDNLGNEYDWGMMGEIGERRGSGTINLHEPLHPDATELIITPFMYVHHWYLGDWRHDGIGSVGEEEVIAGGGSLETREVILGVIVVTLP